MAEIDTQPPRVERPIRLDPRELAMLRVALRRYRSLANRENQQRAKRLLQRLQQEA